MMWLTEVSRAFVYVDFVYINWTSVTYGWILVHSGPLLSNVSDILTSPSLNLPFPKLFQDFCLLFTVSRVPKNSTLVTRLGL